METKTRSFRAVKVVSDTCGPKFLVDIASESAVDLKNPMESLDVVKCSHGVLL